MNPRVEARLEKVKRTSRSARRVCFLLMVFFSLPWIFMVPATLGAPTRICVFSGLQQPCSEMAPEALLFMFVSLVGGIGLVLAALYRLARLFGNYARGEIFTRASVRELRLLGYVAIAYALLNLVLFVVGLALVAQGVVGSLAELRATLRLDTVFIAGSIMMLSWVMDVGAEIREENELTV